MCSVYRVRVSPREIWEEKLLTQAFLGICEKQVKLMTFLERETIVCGTVSMPRGFARFNIVNPSEKEKKRKMIRRERDLYTVC